MRTWAPTAFPDPYGGAGGALRIPELGTDGRWFVSEMPVLIDRAKAWALSLQIQPSGVTGVF